MASIGEALVTLQVELRAFETGGKAPVVGAVSSTVSSPCATAWGLSSSASSGGRSTRMNPSTPAAAASLQKRSTPR